MVRAIRMTPDFMPIDLILHTPGGIVLASEQIAHALSHHPSKVTVFVPHYAMSGGTMIALSADEIVVDENACVLLLVRSTAVGITGGLNNEE
ncbi:ATP-dependent Clp protease proteolytic subunit [Alicyclobacillus fastidiosus]|uniref:ATP-dependent Clp protease proteolytic subunit n=1 Tax=Alicyclobacillus fastidiosus TaxID=392011 RepID=A0ABY6ZNB4_9BACL|nr:ATP-dependent Clp protease proteolytic subunit [Alicyclobacillus fastidiosus]